MPRFDLELTPVREGERWSGFEVSYALDLDSVAAGAELLRLPKVLTSIPGMTIATNDLTVADDNGPLVLTEGEPQPDIAGTARVWSADRATVGTLKVAYFAPVRPIDERTPVGPLFDLRGEQLGLVGAGIWFLVLPATPGLFDEGTGETYHITLRWNAPDLVTISGHGLGDAAWSGELQTVQFCYFAAGTPHTSPRLDPGFGLHVFSDAPFDAAEIAEYLEALYRDMSAFFGTEDSSYHVLVRRNESRGTGGTALPGAFSFGYSAIDETDVAGLRSLLAHEMAHNWPRLDGDATTASWYTEGTAEYYSFVLAYRGGHLSAKDFADTLTDRFAGYDANPLKHLSNDDAYAAYWVDPRAQRIPYGRGLRYFVATNAHLLAATDGQVGLDDLVKRVVTVRAEGGTVDQEGWVALVAEHLGDAAREQYDAMMRGDEIPVPDHVFEGVVRPAVGQVDEVEIGFDMASFHANPRVVSGLVDGSAAAAAGLKNGDQLETRAISYTAVRGRAAVELTIIRDGETIDISYVPRGSAVPTIQFELVEESA